MTKGEKKELKRFFGTFGTIFTILLIAVMLGNIPIFIASCGVDSPTNVAKRWIDGWATGDGEQIIATTVSSQLLYFDFEVMEANDIFAHITLDKEVIVNDKIAYVTMIFDDGGLSQIWLMKDGNEWKVDIIKTLENL